MHKYPLRFCVLYNISSGVQSFPGVSTCFLLSECWIASCASLLASSRLLVRHDKQVPVIQLPVEPCDITRVSPQVMSLQSA